MNQYLNCETSNVFEPDPGYTYNSVCVLVLLCVCSLSWEQRQIVCAFSAVWSLPVELLQAMSYSWQ